MLLSGLCSFSMLVAYHDAFNQADYEIAMLVCMLQFILADRFGSPTYSKEFLLLVIPFF